MMPFLSSEVVSQGLVFRAAPPLWLLVLVIVPALLAFVVLSYRIGRTSGPRWVRPTLTVLRLLAIALVVFLLFDPAQETLVYERKPTLNLVLTDVSASMAHADDYQTSPLLGDEVRAAAGLSPGEPLDTWSRLELLKRTLRQEGTPDLDALREEGRIRLFTFGERLQAVDTLEDLEPRGRVTQLGQALERVLDEPDVKGATIGSIVLLTDGKNTAGPTPEEVLERAGRLEVPIHSVGVGDPRALKDVELASVLGSSVVLAEDTATFELRVRQTGFEGQRVEVRLLDGTRVLHTQAETLTGDDQTITLHYRPLQEGRFTWTVEVRPLPGEHTEDNNRRLVEVTVKDEKIKVLYVDTLPRWEYRKLQSFLTRTPDTFLTQCLLLEANRDFPQERTVGLVGLTRFPETDEELFAYDVIVFGDVDPLADKFSGGNERIAREHSERIRRFVENGGGFAMIAGDRFAPWAYKDTPLADVLPIIVDPTEKAFMDASRGFKLHLTPLGAEHPITQIAKANEGPDANRKIWEERGVYGGLREVYWFARVKKPKPGAIVLAEHETERNAQGPYPILVAGTYGEGPVFFSAIDETWRWYWWQGAYSHHRFWGNVVRYLARTRLFQGDKRFRLLSDRSEYQVGDSVTLTAWVKDKTFRPADFETQEVILVPPDEGGARETLRLRKVEPGRFETSFVATATGDYQAWIPPEDGVTEDRISPISWRVNTSDVERREPVLDEETLRRVSDVSGGRYVNLPELPALLEEAAAGTVEIPRQRRYLELRDPQSGWLQPVLAFFVALLGLEWLLRKRFRYL